MAIRSELKLSDVRKNARSFSLSFSHALAQNNRVELINTTLYHVYKEFIFLNIDSNSLTNSQLAQ